MGRISDAISSETQGRVAMLRAAQGMIAMMEVPDRDERGPQPPPPGPLTARMRWWLHLLDPDLPETRMNRALRHLRESRAGLVGGILIAVLCAVELATSPSLVDVLTMTRFGVGVVVSTFGKYVFQTYTRDVRECYQRLADTAALVESLPWPQVQEDTARAARWDVRIFRGYFCYSVCIVLAVPVGRVPMREPRCVYALAHAALGRGLVMDAAVECLLLFPLYTYASTCTVIMAYMLLAATVSAAQVCTSLQRGIGEALRMERCSPRLAALHWSVLRCNQPGYRVFTSILCSIFGAALIMSLISTVMILTHGLGHDMMLTLSLVVIVVVGVVVPCEVGDLAAAARFGVCFQAYSGPWLEETVPERRLRLGVMQSVHGRFSMTGAGSFILVNRRTCRELLRGWYSYLQVLTKVT